VTVAVNVTFCPVVDGFAEEVTAIVDEAVRGFSSYHTRPIVSRRDPTLQVDDVKLLYYYQNRTAHIPPEAT